MSETQTMEQPSPQEQLFGMFSGFLFSRALHVAAELGIADLLSNGPQPLQVLANTTGCHPHSLYRLLRLLASQGVFAEDETGSFRVKAVHGDISALVAAGVLNKTESGQVEFPFDAVKVEFLLHAA